MRKYIYFLLLFLVLILSHGCYYKELSETDSIVLAENETMSVMFLLNEYGYGESNRFVTKVDNGEKVSICEGKLYKGNLNYKEIIDDNEYVLHNYINNILFYSNENGLQGATFDEELVSDAPYNYLLNGYKELILNYGNSNPFISLFDNTNSNIVKDVDNKNIIYASNKLDSQDKNSITTVYKSLVILYKIEDKIYLKKDFQKNTINDNEVNNEVDAGSINIEICSVSNIKKGFVIDNLSTSITIIQTFDNVIYVINNNTLELKIIKKFSNISSINLIDKWFYVIENNIIYIYNDKIKQVKMVTLEDKIIGSAWYKEVDNSYIKLALLDKNNNVILDRIDINE